MPPGVDPGEERRARQRMPGPAADRHTQGADMLTAVINAETRTPQGKIISTFYRHTMVDDLPAAHAWVKRITRAFTRHTYAYVTISDNPTFTTVSHYRWEYTGGSRYCPGRRLRRY